MKFRALADARRLRKSHPARGAWIEIQFAIPQ